MASSSAKVMCLFIIIGLVVPSLAMNYDVPWRPNSNLDQWVIDKNFLVGDCLHFKPLALEQLLAVIKVDFNAFLYCTGQGVLLVQQGGSTDYIYHLTEPGELCFTAEPLYCPGGLKLNITVKLP